MIRYAVGRGLRSVPLLLGVFTVVFVLFELMPGTAADAIGFGQIEAGARQQVIEVWGLDRPVHERYLVWLTNLVRGDLGVSFSSLSPVTTVLAQKLPNTLLLTVPALIFGFMLGIGVGSYQASRQRTVADRALTVATLAVYGTPSFLIALGFSVAFAMVPAFNGWPVSFPISGSISIGHADLGFVGKVVDRFYHAALPIATLTLLIAVGVSRYVRTAMLEVVREDYIRTARAKGLPRRAVVYGHALRNALIPCVTLLGLSMPTIVGGAVFVEYVFDFEGMGKAMVDAVVRRDLFLAMGGTILFSTLVIAGNLVADLLMPWVDPRIRL